MKIEPYLERIKYSGSLDASFDTLRELHLAHMRSVPFENFDVSLGRAIEFSLPAFYDKIVERRRGGFCYELNGLFAWLLEQLGFDVLLLSARVTHGDVAGPEFDHLVLLIGMNERLIADVGFGDSFIEPLLLDDEREHVQLENSYRLIGSDSEKVLQRRRESDWEPQYVFSSKPRALSEFAGMCQHHQVSPESTFTQKTVCSIATPQGRITLANNRLVTTVGRIREEREISGKQEYRNLLRNHFGIELEKEGLEVPVSLSF